MAPERLRELGRLPVAHAVRHLADGQPAPAQHLGGSLHPHRREVLPEGRVADLAEGALELATGGRHPSRDVVERELGGELARHDRGGVLVEAGPEAYCCWSLHGLDLLTPHDAARDELHVRGTSNLARRHCTEPDLMLDCANRCKLLEEA